MSGHPSSRSSILALQEAHGPWSINTQCEEITEQQHASAHNSNDPFLICQSAITFKVAAITTKEKKRKLVLFACVVPNANMVWVETLPTWLRLVDRVRFKKFCRFVFREHKPFYVHAFVWHCACWAIHFWH